MKVENVFEIQDALKQVPCVSVPWLQKRFSLSYREAKELLAQLTLRGWVSREVRGNQYRVLGVNLQLRRIDRAEAPSLYNAVTVDCVNAMSCIQKKPNGATMDEIATAVRGEEDTAEALAMLRDHNLIYSYDDLYFSCISKKDSSALYELQQARRRNAARKTLLDEDEDEGEEKLQELFDRLFGA